MEHYEKMILVPFNYTLVDDCRPILEKAIDLFKKGMVNEKLYLKINGAFDEKTNVIDYLLDNNKELPYSSKFEENNKTKKILYTKVSPVQLRNNKNNKIKWVF